jgi:hypothetical protein
MPRNDGLLSSTLDDVCAVPSLYHDVLSDPNFVVTSSAADFPVRLGGFFEVILAISVIGTAVTCFRWSEGKAKDSLLATSWGVS